MEILRLLLYCMCQQEAPLSLEHPTSVVILIRFICWGFGIRVSALSSYLYFCSQRFSLLAGQIMQRPAGGS